MLRQAKLFRHSVLSIRGPHVCQEVVRHLINASVGLYCWPRYIWLYLLESNSTQPQFLVVNIRCSFACWRHKALLSADKIDNHGFCLDGSQQVNLSTLRRRHVELVCEFFPVCTFGRCAGLLTRLKCFLDPSMPIYSPCVFPPLVIDPLNRCTIENPKTITVRETVALTGLSPTIIRLPQPLRCFANSNNHFRYFHFHVICCKVVLLFLVNW